MAHRLIAQVILIGTQVVGRAFVQAYRQAAANSAAASAHASKTATSRVPGSNLLTKQTGIDVDEACKILNVKKESLILEEINKRYDYLFSQNDPKKGGSAYLQAKVFRAKERLELELKAQAPAKEKEAEAIKQQTGAEAGKKWSDNDSMRM